MFDHVGSLMLLLNCLPDLLFLERFIMVSARHKLITVHFTQLRDFLPLLNVFRNRIFYLAHRGISFFCLSADVLYFLSILFLQIGQIRLNCQLLRLMFIMQLLAVLLDLFPFGFDWSVASLCKFLHDLNRWHQTIVVLNLWPLLFNLAQVVSDFLHPFIKNILSVPFMLV